MFHKVILRLKLWTWVQTFVTTMTKELVSKLSIIGLRKTPTILQLADSSTIIPNGMLEDVTITLHSWEYLVDFVVFSPKISTLGYPIILG